MTSQPNGPRILLECFLEQYESFTDCFLILFSACKCNKFRLLDGLQSLDKEISIWSHCRPQEDQAKEFDEIQCSVPVHINFTPYLSDTRMIRIMEIVSCVNSHTRCNASRLTKAADASPASTARNISIPASSRSHVENLSSINFRACRHCVRYHGISLNLFLPPQQWQLWNCSLSFKEKGSVTLNLDSNQRFATSYIFETLVNAWCCFLLMPLFRYDGHCQNQPLWSAWSKELFPVKGERLLMFF